MEHAGTGQQHDQALSAEDEGGMRDNHHYSQMATSQKDILLGMIRSGEGISFRQQAQLTLTLSAPAILAQLASVLLQYIDASMVGSLGANPAASIGLVSTSIWIFGGFCSAAGSGFSVQIAHLIGANDFVRARQVLRQGLMTVTVFSVLLAFLGVGISGALPRWLGGTPDIHADASRYFLIFTACLPCMQLSFFGSSVLQGSGNMKLPSLLSVLMCALDVVFNFLFIFPGREIHILGLSMNMWGAGLGVTGAALGTVTAEAITMFLMLYFLLFRSPELRLTQDRGSFRPTSSCLRSAWTITGPMWLQNVVMRGAYIASTVIVAPLGAVSIAANTFAITAESFCYMPGYGTAEAATTLVGQSLGAKRKELAREFARISVGLGTAMMTALAVLMFIFAPVMMSIMSPVQEVVDLGTRMLRIEAFAETMYAVSIVAYGVCVGAGDTLVPSLLNFCSMWLVRIALAMILVPKMGLQGYWIAMAVELNIRGLLFLWRLRSRRWMKFTVTKG